MTEHDNAWPTFLDDMLDHPKRTGELDFILNLTRTPARVLELGCGAGRLSVPLAEAGYQVTGLDNNTGALARAQAIGAARLDLVNADFCTYQLPDRFDLIVCVFNAINYAATAERQRLLLSTARTHLREGGQLLIEFTSAIAVHEEWAGDARVVPVALGEARHPLFMAGRLDRASQHLYLSYLHLENGLFCQVTHLHRIVTEAEFRLMSELAGLEVVETFGDWDRSPFTAGSEKLICLLRARSTPAA